MTPKAALPGPPRPRVLLAKRSEWTPWWRSPAGLAPSGTPRVPWPSEVSCDPPEEGRPVPAAQSSTSPRPRRPVRGPPARGPQRQAPGCGVCFTPDQVVSVYCLTAQDGVLRLRTGFHCFPRAALHAGSLCYPMTGRTNAGGWGSSRPPCVVLSGRNRSAHLKRGRRCVLRPQRLEHLGALRPTSGSHPARLPGEPVTWLSCQHPDDRPKVIPRSYRYV